MFSQVWDKIKEILSKMLGNKTVEQVLHVSPSVSGPMADAIQLWSDMYEGKSPWLREPTYDSPVRITSMGLPALIASEKARMATIEMESEINAPVAEIEVANPEYVPPSLDEFGNMSMGRGSMTKKEDVPTGPTERAEFLNDQYTNLKKQIRRQLEYGIAKGGLVIKPYPIIYDDFTPSPAESLDFDKSQTTADSLDKSANSENKTISADSSTVATATTKTDEKSTTAASDSISVTSKNANVDNNTEVKEKKQYNAEIGFDFIQADGFFPLAFDAGGKVIEAAFIQRKVDKDVVYSRVEYHKLERRTITVQNMAFKANTGGTQASTFNTDLGMEIPLTDVPEWASLEPVIQIKDVDRLLFAYFKMPEANTVDTYSPLGVSGYSRVVNLIKDADMQYSRLLWEYEGGEMAIDVDRDALKLVQDNQGRDITIRPMSQERLFRKVDLNAEDTYNVFAPTLRDANYISGLNAILMRIEDATGMSRGTISDSVSYEAKTATELKILKQRSYSTNADIQMALEEALRDCIYVMDVYCSLYHITPEGEYEVSFEWDDSILIDSESELSKRLTLMQNGLASKQEIRMWYFGETENQAKAKLQEIEDEQKQALEDNMMAQSRLGQQVQDQGEGAGMFKDQNAGGTESGVTAKNNERDIEKNDEANGEEDRAKKVLGKKNKSSNQ